MSVLPLVDAIAGDTFRTLVRQFSQELCFYRELIQNAVDAGTQRVELWTRHQDGLATIHVRDDGEGMDSAAIHDHLTRLFASPKEDDFTKVGKFGIGFVSIFAIEPQEVVLETGRNGEYWTVVFNARGEFERRPRPEPVEGTHIRISKPMQADAYASFVSRSIESIRYWCRYCPADIDFNGVRLNEPFGVDGPIQVCTEAHGTVVAAALGSDASGFYNGGITLWEGPWRQDWLSGVGFRINSRYLRHTLSRDGVRTDGHFHKAIALLKRTVTVELMAEMYRALERDPSLLPLCAPYVRRHPPNAKACWIPQVDGPPLSLEQVRRSEPALRMICRRVGARVAWPFDTESTAVSKALIACEVPTLNCDEALLSDLGVPTARGHLVLPHDVSDINVPSQLRKLLAAATELLHRCGVRFASAGFGHWTPAERASVWRRRGQTLAGLESLPGAHDRLLLHVGHPLVVRLTVLSETDMAGASYLLARAVCLAGGVPAGLRGRLLSRALERLS